MGPTIAAAAAALLVSAGVLALTEPTSAAHGARSAPIITTVAAAGEIADSATHPGAAAGVAAGSAAPGPRTPAVVVYDWPTGAPADVERGFDRPAMRWSTGHRGVDLRVSPGEPVLAASDGVVAFAGSVAGRWVISIDHADGIRTTYEPVVPALPRGAVVRMGEVIGHLDASASHCAPASCLHWGARRGGDDYLDPLSLLRVAVIRLYPYP